jgi:hypothetical protein
MMRWGVSLWALSLAFVLSSCGVAGDGEATADAPDGAAPAGAGGPYDDTASLRPDLIQADPSRAAPGAAVELAFPEGTDRGVAYVLEVRTGDGWETRFFLTAVAEGYDLDEPHWGPAGEDYAWDDVGVEGHGPDVIRIPDTAAPGSYRLCTANAVENFCTELEVTPPG